MTVEDIVEKFNISKRSVYTINNGSFFYDKTIDYPIKKVRRGTSPSTEDILEIRELLKTYHTKVAIAEKFNITRQTVANINNGVGKYKIKDGTNYPIR